jgi:hypothetical protein
LQLQSLCELKTDEAVRERIGRLPPKLEDLYLELYEKVIKYPAEADRQITRITLSWLLCAQRRLKSAEFLAALSMTPRRYVGQVTKGQVLDLCCNMVVFDSTLDTFRFAHLSVREFLEKQPEYTSTAINSLAAETCILELLSAVVNPATNKFLTQWGQPLRSSTGSHGLSSYSTVYWARHCQLATDQRTSSGLSDIFLFFLSGALDPMSAFSVWTHQFVEELTHKHYSSNDVTTTGETVKNSSLADIEISAPAIRPLRKVKVALIDTGVDLEELADGIENFTGHIVRGISFMQQGQRISPWWLPSKPHGTQQARLICAIDPSCDLYVAKVGSDPTCDISTKRVVKVSTPAGPTDMV